MRAIGTNLAFTNRGSLETICQLIGTDIQNALNSVIALTFSLSVESKHGLRSFARLLRLLDHMRLHSYEHDNIHRPQY